MQTRGRGRRRFQSYRERDTSTEVISIAISAPKELIDEIDRVSEELGITRSELIRQGVEIRLRINKDDYGVLRKAAQKEGIFVSKLIQEGISYFVTHKLLATRHSEESAQGSPEGANPRRRGRPEKVQRERAR